MPDDQKNKTPEGQPQPSPNQPEKKYTDEDLTKARLDERKKLNDKLEAEQSRAQIAEQQAEKLQTQVDSLKGDLAKRDKTIEDQSTQMDSLKESIKENNEIDVEKLLESTSSKLREQVEKQLGKSADEMRTEMKELRADNERLKLEVYKRERLAELRSQEVPLIEEVISGNTKEDFENSIEKSRKLAEKYLKGGEGSPTEPPTPDDTDGPPRTPERSPATPHRRGEDAEVAEIQEKLKDLDPRTASNPSERRAMMRERAQLTKKLVTLQPYVGKG